MRVSPRGLVVPALLVGSLARCGGAATSQQAAGATGTTGATTGTGASTTTGGAGGAASTGSGSSGYGGAAGGATTGGAGGTAGGATTSSGSGGAAGSPPDAGPDAGPTATYSAYSLVTNVPRYVLFAADALQDTCVIVRVELGAGGLGIVASPGWTVASANVTNHAADCAFANGAPVQPAGTVVGATSGSGTLTLQHLANGCTTSVHATLVFPPMAAWVPASAALGADGVSVVGGCP